MTESMGTLYDTDFAAWAHQQAEHLRKKAITKLDYAHLAEEIEALGISDERAITRQLQRLLLHLLKWRYQPTHRTPSWRRSIRQARDTIADRLERSPSLREYPAQRLPLAYRRARRDAGEDTGLPLATFPEACEWDIGALLAEDFFPPAYGEDMDG
jgi:Domain of unknown function DUF29